MYHNISTKSGRDLSIISVRCALGMKSSGCQSINLVTTQFFRSLWKSRYFGFYKICLIFTLIFFCIQSRLSAGYNAIAEVRSWQNPHMLPSDAKTLKNTPANEIYMYHQAYVHPISLLYLDI